MTLMGTEGQPVEEYSEEERTEAQSFLRTGPDAAGNVSGESTVKTGPCADPLFPFPAVNAEFTAQLDGCERFAAMAVRIDPPATTDQDGILHATLTRSFESLTSTDGVRWFSWDTGLYGCILPGADACFGNPMAQRIQADLARSHVATVSIGISQFPLLDFNREDALRNACKALDHAAFFGAGSIVIFDAVSLNISGDRFYQAGACEAAIAEYRNALRLDTANVNVHNSLGICLAQTGKRTEARAAFEEALRLNPGEAMAIYNIGILHLLDGDEENALCHFRQAFALDGRTFDIPFHIGKLLTRKKAYAEAVSYLEKALTMSVGYAPAHSLVGRCLASLGRSTEAIAAYKKAIKINPNDAAALSALGALYDAKGENTEICLTFCRQSIALSPQNGLFRLRLARLYHKHNQLERALVEYETATALGCDSRRQIAEIQEQLDAPGNDRQCCA